MCMYVFCDHEDDNTDNMMMCHAAAVTVGGNTEDQFGNTMPLNFTLCVVLWWIATAMTCLS